MEPPTPHLGQPLHARTRIGEVAVLLYAMERGQAEVRLRFPDKVTAAERARFRELVLGELERALRASGAH